jgi:hypothetical protein
VILTLFGFLSCALLVAAPLLEIVPESCNKLSMTKSNPTSPVLEQYLRASELTETNFVRQRMDQPCWIMRPADSGRKKIAE